MATTNPLRGLELGAQLAERRTSRNQRLGIGIKESRRAEVINRFERAKAQEEAEKQAKKSKGGLGSLVGTGGGAAIGALLAIPTGGLSVAAGAGIGAAIGGTAGSAFDPRGSVNFGPAVGSAFGAAASVNTVSYDELINGAGSLVTNPPGILPPSPGDHLHSSPVGR